MHIFIHILYTFVYMYMNLGGPEINAGLGRSWHGAGWLQLGGFLQ